MLRVQNVEKSFGSRRVLKDINLEFQDGGMVFIIGKSGAGKTTLLNLLGAIEKPTCGEITYNDGEKEINITDDEASYRGKYVGFVFQDFNLIEGLTIKENIDLALTLSDGSLDDGFTKEYAGSYDICNISQKAETLSGGEKQRAAIIRAMLKDSKIILADEPTGNLDVQNSEYVFEKLHEASKKKTVIIVTHDLESAKRYADRIITLSDGCVVSDECINRNPAGQSKKEPLIKKAGFFEKAGNYFRILRNSLKKRRARIAAICTVIALSISFLAITVNLYFNSKELNENLNINYLETDLISVFHDKDKGSMYQTIADRPIGDNVLSSFEASGNVNACVEIYGLNDYILSCESNYSSYEFRQIELNEFFEKRIMSLEVYGSFPKKSNEIIIGQDAAEYLFENQEEAVGKTVTISSSDGKQSEAVVVGINRTQNSAGTYLNYISNDMTKQLEELKYSEAPESVSISKFIPADYTGAVDSFLPKAMLRYTGGEENLIDGRFPERENEILVSSGFYDMLPEKDKGEIFSKGYFLKLAVAGELRIVGTYMSDEIEVSVSESFIKALSRVEPKRADCYIANPKLSDEFIEQLKELDGTLLGVSVYQNLRENISDKNQTLQASMFWISCAFVITALITIYAFSKINVMERKHEIAILRSLGMRGRGIYAVLNIDIIAIILMSFVLSVIMSMLLTLMLPKLFEDLSMSKITYPIDYTLAITSAMLLVGCVCASIQVKKCMRTTIADLLRQRI